LSVQSFYNQKKISFARTIPHFNGRTEQNLGYVSDVLLFVEVKKLIILKKNFSFKS